jgi:low temperature requirement protein LtrA
MTVASLAVAFGGNVALWWIYFDRAAEQAADTMARHHDPGRLGRAAYVYLHLPMVAGVLVTAVGDKLAVSSPTGTTAAATAATVLGGPALFVAGHALFKWVLFGLVSTPRLLGVAALAALVPAAAVVTPLTLSLLATLLLVGVAAWDVVCPPTLGQPPELARDGWPALTNRAGAPRGEGGADLDAADVSVSLAHA